jgi:hypothetical protein
MYDRLNVDERLHLEGSTCLTATGDCPIREIGKAAFNIQLGELNIVREIIFADIEDDALMSLLKTRKALQIYC